MSRPVWVSAAVLKVLAEHGLGRPGATFTASELKGWVDGSLTRGQRLQATGVLGRAGFWTTEQTHEGASGSEHRYTITPEGAAAIVEAGQGKVRKSGPRGGPQPPRTPSANSLVMRLWKLFRIRGALDPDAAARTLCDAGDTAAFKRTRASIAAYLVRWAGAGAADVAAKRVGAVGQSRGFKRYVLREEWKASALPPAWTELAKAHGQGSHA